MNNKKFIVPKRFRECGSLLLYVPDFHKMVFVQDGAGDQLLHEDFENGYNDYIDWVVTDYDPYGDRMFGKDYGGIYMYNNEGIDNWQSMISNAIWDALELDIATPIDEIEIIVVYDGDF